MVEDQDLTAREAELIELMAQGYSNKEIADRLFLSPHTVKTHLGRAFRKWGVRNRVEAATWWVRHGQTAANVDSREDARPASGFKMPRWRVLAAGVGVPVVLAAVAGGLAFAGSSGSAEQHCVAEAAISSSQQAQLPPTARCFYTLEEAISFATHGSASSIEELSAGDQ